MASKQRLKQAQKSDNQAFASFPNTQTKVINSQSEYALQNEKLRHERLIGQLKAAEARNR
jgi:hypothetical protein